MQLMKLAWKRPAAQSVSAKWSGRQTLQKTWETEKWMERGERCGEGRGGRGSMLPSACGKGVGPTHATSEKDETPMSTNLQTSRGLGPSSELASDHNKQCVLRANVRLVRMRPPPVVTGTSSWQSLISLLSPSRLQQCSAACLRHLFRRHHHHPHCRRQDQPQICLTDVAACRIALPIVPVRPPFPCCCCVYCSSAEPAAPVGISGIVSLGIRPAVKLDTLLKWIPAAADALP